MLKFAFGLQRFGGLEYVPRVVGLGIVRIDGASATAGAACCLMIGILHQRPHVASLQGVARLKAAGIAALSVPVLYAPTLAVVLASALAFGRVNYGFSSRAFFEALTRDDWMRGVLYAVLFCAFPAAWFLFGRPIWAARRSLAFKLLAFYLVSLVMRVTLSVIAEVVS